MQALLDRCKVVISNIVLLEVDAIVNAANTSLLGGGGVDGAIHRAAGPDLEHACRMLNGCKVGEAKLTPGFRLRAGHIIHTVGPVWQDGRRGEADLLASCYRKSLAIAAERRFGSIAFPAISTGIYRFPKREAARVAVAEVFRFIGQSEFPETVTFCCFDREMADLYTGAIEDGLSAEH